MSQNAVEERLLDEEALLTAQLAVTGLGDFGADQSSRTGMKELIETTEAMKPPLFRPFIGQTLNFLAKEFQ
jgi:hypothetical protein